MAAEAVVLALPPDEAALVVDVTRGLDSGDMMEQAISVLVQPANCVGGLYQVLDCRRALFGDRAAERRAIKGNSVY